MDVLNLLCFLYLLCAQLGAASPVVLTNDDVSRQATNTTHPERRADSSRLSYFGCTAQQVDLLANASIELPRFAQAGESAAACTGLVPRFDSYSHFFNRNSTQESDIVAGIMRKIYDRTAPASEGPANALVLPVRCAAQTDNRCAMPDRHSRLAYASLHHLGTGNEVRLMTQPQYSETGYTPLITLCPSLWNEVAPLPPRCQPGVSQAAMPTTLTSVLFRQIVELASGLGIHDGGPGLTVLGETVEECKMCKDLSPAGRMVGPITNAGSYVNFAYLAWKAGWGSPLNTSQAVNSFVSCLTGVFGPM